MTSWPRLRRFMSSGKGKRVILFLVEGPSDETSLVGPFKNLWGISGGCSTIGVESEAFFCDVTTVHLFHDPVSFSVTNHVLQNVNSLIKERINRRHAYNWGDLRRIIHIVDLDGAFIPKSCIRQGEEPGFVYDENFIEVPDITKAEMRNSTKAASLRKLVSTSTIKHGNLQIPYGVYYLSRNLEHALHGLTQDISDSDKEALSVAFADQYSKDSEGFVRLLQSSAVCAPGKGYKETWDYVQQGTNSLKRGSNLHLLINCLNGDMLEE